MYRIATDRLLKNDGSGTLILVNGAGNVFTRAHRINSATSMVLGVRVKSATGSPDIDVYLEQTALDPYSAAEGNIAATGQGSQDGDNAWKTVGSKLADLTDTNWQYITLAPLTLPWLRILLDGQGSSPADTIVEVVLSKQEQF